jgi:hypothetical protein
MTTFNHLNIPDEWGNYFTKYPQGYTMLEALMNWVQQVDDMVDNLNLSNAQLENLQTYVNTKIDELLSTGELNVMLEDVTRLYIENDGNTSTDYAMEIANFGNNGTIDRRAFVIHHYNDEDMAVLDNVGEGNVFLLLRNANNVTRRPDKDALFYGTGDFMRLQNMYNNNGDLQAVTVLEVQNDGTLDWQNQGPPINKGVTLKNSQPSSNGNFAFTMHNVTANSNVLKIKAEDTKDLLFIQNPTQTRADIVSSSVQTAGMKLQAGAGDIELQAGGTTGQIKLDSAAFSKKADGTWAQIGRFVSKPATATSTGERGDYFCDTTYLYVCQATNSWVRTAVAAW